MPTITPDKITISQANNSSHLEEALILFREYAESLPVDLSFQNFEEELQTIDQQYQKPTGGILLAHYNANELAGCAAVRQFENDIGELKRMYIRKDFRGIGLGQKLLDLSFDLAKDLGYIKIRLDTLPSMASAIKLYQKNGFSEIEAYRFNPVEGTMYFERNLL